MRKDFRLYNLLFPIWLLVFLPSWLWLMLIPANFLIDYAVVRWTMKGLKIETFRQKALKHTWKVCLLGFLSDFIGALLLFGVYMYLSERDVPAYQTLSYNIAFNPFADVFSLLIVVLGILTAAVFIYFFNSIMFKKDPDLNEKQIHRIALMLAVFTAPYIFLFPSYLLYV